MAYNAPMPDPVRTGEKVFRGIPVSAGVCHGKALVLGRQANTFPQYEIPPEDCPKQIQRVESALLETRRQLAEVQRRVLEQMGADNAGIFEAHLMVLEDPTLISEVIRTIEQRRINAEVAFFEVSERYAKALDMTQDEYLRERAGDIRDVISRVIQQLQGNSSDPAQLRDLREPCIIIAHDLDPSTTAQLDKSLVLGLATDTGGRTSHTAILARSQHIPAAVGLKDITQHLETGHYIVLDGYNGLVILNPTDQTLFEYGQLVKKHASLDEKLKDIRDKPAVTLDGVKVVLSANIDQPEDGPSIAACGAEGVGLYRTEYLFINRDRLPTEDEQYETYRSVAADAKPHSIIIRTLDLGGDKMAAHLKAPPESNPFLGWRAIRVCLQEQPMFRAQLRAILRASVVGNVKIMYPMICNLNELLQANRILEECKAELAAQRIPFDRDIEVGIMIEIPSAVAIADVLAKRVKFFSIGTNDLIQYTLAVDRLNERVAHLYQPTHPGLLRFIKQTVEAAHKHGIWVGVCGEMAGDMELTPLLLGLGVDELSATPSVVPEIKALIRRLKMSDAKKLAEFALESESESEILTRSRELAAQAAPHLFDPLRLDPGI